MLKVMSEDEIRAFVKKQLNEVYNGCDASDAAEEALVKKWVDDRENHGMNERDEGRDAGYSDGHWAEHAD
jgi:hypothetical protein